MRHFTIIINRSFLLILFGMQLSCGARHKDVSRPAIIGGRPAEPGEHESVVAILRNGAPICSGTVISPAVVLSAAHCFERFLTTLPVNLSAIEIFHGRDATDLSSGTVHQVSKIEIHPGYWTDLRSSLDFAVLETATTFASKPIELALFRSETDHFTDSSQVVTIVGYGLIQNALAANMLISNHGIKHVAEARTHGGRGDEIFVGDERSDTCLGDSGGPALTTSGSTSKLVAVTARGPSPCAQANEPGTMTLTRAGACWLSEVVPRALEEWTKACELERSEEGWQPAINELSTYLSTTDLNLASKNLRDISWLSDAINLESLNLAWNRIDDLRPLLGLFSLKSLDIRGNNITDLTTLTTLKSRGVIVIGERSLPGTITQTEFSRISSLGAAAGVEQRATTLALREILAVGTNERRSFDLATRVYLGLNNRGVRSLNPIAYLESTEVLLLQSNPLVKDLTPILTLPKLRFLDIRGTAAADSGNDQILQTLAERGVRIRRFADEQVVTVRF